MKGQPKMKELGDLIRSARKKAGQTQHSLGAQLGFSGGQFISNLERGLQVLPPRHIPKIANALGLEQDVLLNALLDIQACRIRNKSCAA